LKAGEIIAQTLRKYGLEYFFALTGGDQEIWLALRDAGIKYILPHSERSGVAMADAYARVTAKPSFTYGQFGPGAALCVSGMADSYWGQSPVIAITSSMGSSSLYRYSYQGIDDQQGLFKSITKWTARVPNIERLPDMLRTAIRTAVSGVPGPVHLDIPIELTLFSKSDLPDVQLYAESEFKRFPACRVAPGHQDIERLLALLAQAHRPLILAGGGVIASEAWDDLVRFAEALSIPVVTSSAGKSSIASDHGLYAGAVGNYSSKVANTVAARCDTYIVIGSNLGDHATKQRQAPGRGVRILHIDLNPQVLGTNYKEDVSVVGDAKLVLKEMIKAAEASGFSKKACAWSAWVAEVQSMVKSWRAAMQDKARHVGAEGAINSYFVMDALNRILGPDDVVVADTGYMGAFGNVCIEVKRPGRNYVRTAGSLGWGFPAALGAQCAVGENARVVCISGDGGFGYHVSEVETAVRYGLPVLVVVLNNKSLGFEYHLQKLLYKDIAPEANDYSDIDYGAVARAFGGYGDRVRNPEDVETALRKALDSGEPAVVDITVDKEIYGPVVYYESVEDRDV
jgi:acetolactate synthase-1/2/3 large subunit